MNGRYYRLALANGSQKQHKKGFSHIRSCG